MAQVELKIYISTVGMSNIALGKEPNSWGFGVLLPHVDLLPGCLELGRVKVTLPEPSECTPYLEAELARLRAVIAQDEAAKATRLQAVVAASAASTVVKTSI